jgi:hypothetical protein
MEQMDIEERDFPALANPGLEFNVLATNAQSQNSQWLPCGYPELHQGPGPSFTFNDTCDSSWSDSY